MNIQTEARQHHILLMLCNNNDRMKIKYIEYTLQNTEYCIKIIEHATWKDF